MPTAWRILPARFASEAFTGEGAWRVGGRWNSPGVRMVYASEHKSLAVLETLVHVDPHRPMNFLCFRLEIPETVIERSAAGDLPLGWQVEPPASPTQQVGDAWARAGRSAVLAVPSALIPEELNYLLDPVHRDFARITLAKPTPFTFDPRLLN
jgi:RES domain-containing protein